MQAVLGNYVKSKIYLEELLKGEGKHPISGIQEDIIHAVIGFFGAEEWELCSEACFYLRLLEEHLTKTGKTSRTA
jgi:hypothetical protein